jgi:hypothetical protein
MGGVGATRARTRGPEVVIAVMILMMVMMVMMVMMALFKVWLTT